ncbi:MAG: small ribosomal subunit Rsm22 family protein [Chlamydiales bacterium]
MQLPEELQSAINQILEKTPQNALRKAREGLSQDYREGRVSPFSDEAKRLAYLGARMPATYAAVRKALEGIDLGGHLLDLGAGPGTASWAAVDAVERITLIEKSSKAVELGKELGTFHPKLRDAVWLEQSLEAPIPNGDVAILSYVLGELDNPLAIVQKAWDAAPLLVIIEPGTPKGFLLIRKIRQALIDQGAHLIAPCPHALACPIQGGDWCHFSARIERTRLHRALKEGTLGYEDEKFCYLIVSKKPGNSSIARIVRHPLKLSGHVRLTLCNSQGLIEEKTVSRKDQALYRWARNAEWGDVM